MSDTLTTLERVTIQLGRNRRAGIKPASQRDLAQYMEKSPTYIGDLLRGNKLGPSGREHLKKILSYVGVE
ncbi:XRE family transcriptional regulator [Levilactobacillus lanxiensis]|uniref:XRE family transcriptional regulator n=1 Tax=Levilactobacillus lanxiensis TaxID=2799568 RepID=A0ABW4D0Y5_9LACO|nr:XRE family transcriptional regulator [Levilactobacillus lanxiensis]